MLVDRGVVTIENRYTTYGDPLDASLPSMWRCVLLKWCSFHTGVYVKDLTSFVVKGVTEINNVLAVGKKNRTVGATLMNQVRRRKTPPFTCWQTV